jgi:Double zinc ribbon
MSVCLHCGAELGADARFCDNCGAPAAPPARFCGECGGELEPGSTFCSLCGARVDAAPAAAAGPDEAHTMILPPAPASSPAATTYTRAAPAPIEPAYPAAAPGPPGKQRSLGWLLWLVAAVVLVAVVGGAAFVVTRMIDRPHNGASSAGTTTGQVSGVSASPEGSPAAGVQPASSGSPSSSPVATVSRASERQQIEASLHAYFAGINAGDYRAAWEQFTSRLKNRAPLAKFAAGDSSSHDTNVVVHWVKWTNSRTAIAYVTFSSTQNSAQGPNGDTADNWTLEYTMKLVNGRWLINGDVGHNGSKYTSG